MARTIPPIRPRQIIGRVSGNGVLMTSEFMRWLDELRREVDTQTIITTSVSGSVSTTYQIQNPPVGLAATSYVQADEALAATFYETERADSAGTTYETTPVEVVSTEYT